MKVLGRAVLIKPDKLPERTKSGALVIPENSREMLPETGTIVDLGSACKEAVKGSHVQFSRKSASVINLDGKDYYFTLENKIFYIHE